MHAACAHAALANYQQGEGLTGVYVSDALIDALEAAGSRLAVPPVTVAYFEGCHTSTRSQYPTTSFDWGRMKVQLPSNYATILRLKK